MLFKINVQNAGNSVEYSVCMSEKTGAHASKIELPRLSSRGRSWVVISNQYAVYYYMSVKPGSQARN